MVHHELGAADSASPSGELERGDFRLQDVLYLMSYDLNAHTGSN